MEVEIDERIKMFWVERERYLPEEFVQEVEGMWRPFKPGTANEPERAVEFLSHLNLSAAEDFLLSLYSREPHCPPIGMLKAGFLMIILGFKFLTYLHRYLMTHPEDAKKLGLVKNGRIVIPSYQNLWYFFNVRMKGHWDDLFALLRDEVVRVAKDHGLDIGRGVAEDSTPIKALKGDKEANYNAHYKVTGYKLDTVTDINTHIPLAKRVVDINASDAESFVPQFQELHEHGILPEDGWIDGGYDSYAVLAWAGINGIQCHHPIHKNWVRNPKGDEENIKRLYHKYWKDDEFHVEADIDYMLRFLYEKGKYEYVGAHYRNRNMDRYEEDPETYMAEYHLRNRQEGNQGYWKEHLDLEKNQRVKGLEKVDQYLTMALCAILAIALCRLQHGVTENLTSVAYLT